MHHLIGKEIIRFHCVWWPAMCMAAGIDPPAHVQVHGWLLLGGQDVQLEREPDRAADLADEYGVDPHRYHLLRDVRWAVTAMPFKACSTLESPENAMNCELFTSRLTAAPGTIPPSMG